MPSERPTSFLVEPLAEAAHEGWMAGKREAGTTSRKAEWGEELMVPYAELSDRAKELDRQAVAAVLAALARIDHVVVSGRDLDRLNAMASRAIAGSTEGSKERLLATKVLAWEQAKGW